MDAFDYAHLNAYVVNECSFVVFFKTLSQHLLQVIWQQKISDYFKKFSTMKIKVDSFEKVNLIPSLKYRKSKKKTKLGSRIIKGPHFPPKSAQLQTNI